MISQQAYIHPSAKIGNNVTVYPFAYIEADTVIGDNCVIYPYVSIMAGTTLGTDNTVHQGTVLGAVPQDFRYTGDKTALTIGNHNIIRENVVINRATNRGGQTVVGNGNVLMEGAHISHDTVVGNNCVFGYGSKIDGDCRIDDGVIFSSSVIENAKTHVGTGAMIQAGTTFSKDVPPYIICTKRSEYGGVNYTMGRAGGIDERVLRHIANAYRLVFNSQTSVFDATNQIEQQVPDSPEIRSIIQFLRHSEMGIISKM